jgi:hypothetical protein
MGSSRRFAASGGGALEVGALDVGAGTPPGGSAGESAMLMSFSGKIEREHLRHVTNAQP